MLEIQPRSQATPRSCRIQRNGIRIDAVEGTMWTTIKIALLAAGVTVTGFINASTAAACDAPAVETASAHSPAATADNESKCLAAE
jgi:hypothetical protein